MENSLRKHILSSYALIDKTTIIPEQKTDAVLNGVSEVSQFPTDAKGPTAITETIENTGLDEFMISKPAYIGISIGTSKINDSMLNGPTGLTHAIEDSDPDEFVISGGTLETRAIETSDPDEIHMDPTKHTFTIEVSDEDAFVLM